MPAKNVDLLEEIRQEQIQSQRQMKSQTTEAWKTFAQMGPFDFQTGREVVLTAGTAAIQRLLPVALRDTGQSGVIAKFLLGLYDGYKFPFDMTELRRLDQELLMDCITLLMMDSMREKEVHQYLENGGAIWRQMAEDWGLLDAKK